jgi:hypothetical protein
MNRVDTHLRKVARTFLRGLGGFAHEHSQSRRRTSVIDFLFGFLRAMSI